MNTMKYDNATIRAVTKEFEHNSRNTLIEEIVKHRKMINGLTHAMQNAINDLKRPNSDGTIALSDLDTALNTASYTEKSEFFNITKNKENSKT